MTAIPGRLSKLQVSDDGGVTYVPYGGIVDITMNLNIDELETTTHDSAGAREYIPNHHDATLDISGRWLDGDPGQEVVLQAVFAKTVFNFKFTMETLSGKKIYTGRAFATSASPSGPLDDTGSMDITLRTSGLLQGSQV
jgi:predicted secreted protein